MTLENGDSVGQTSAQVAAIKSARALSEDLIGSHPEIADLYRGGLSQPEIVARLGIDKMALTMRIARSAVVMAIQRLIPDEGERRRLALIQRRRSVLTAQQAQTPETRRAHGLDLHQRGLGLHGLSPEARSKIGTTVVRLRLGIHASNTQERKEVARQAVIAGGRIPWDDFIFDIESRLDEHRYLLRLLDDTSFQYKKGDVRVHDLVAIARELNRVFHKGERVRTTKSIRMFKAQRSTHRH